MNQAVYNYWREKIVKYLRKKRKAVSLDQMSEELESHKATVLRWVNILELQGILKTEIVDRKKYVELVKK